MPFAIAPPALFLDRRLLASDLRTLLALLSFTRPDEPTCWPSRRSIGERCGITSLSRISHILTRLARLGWIEITHRDGSNLYRITPPEITPPSTPVCRGGGAGMRAHRRDQGEQTKSPLTPVPGELAFDGQEQQTTEAQEPAPEVAQERIQAAQRVILHLNTKTGSRLPEGRQSATVRQVSRRVAKYGAEKLIAVIDHKAKQWQGTDLFKHLTPRTLFRPLALEGYLSEIEQMQHERTQRLQREQEQHAQRRLPALNPASRETAQEHMKALRRTLSMSRLNR